MNSSPVRVVRVDDPDGCELEAPDHRGELYAVELDCGMVLRVVLCRHHLRTLRHTIVEV